MFLILNNAIFIQTSMEKETFNKSDAGGKNDARGDDKEMFF